MPDMQSYTVRLNEAAVKMLTEIKDKRVQNLILQRAEQLAIEPEKQGKPLTEESQDFGVCALSVSVTELSMRCRKKKF